MYRGTTPTLIIKITGEFDYSEVTFLQVTIRALRQAVTYTKSQVVWDGEHSRLLIQMSQSDTLSLSGECGVQMRYQIRNGNTFTTNKAKITFDPILSNNVIGEDYVQVRMSNVEADLEPEENEGEAEIEVDHGETIEGDPRIYDIKRNGVVLPIDEDGVVNINVPVNISELEGSSAIISSLSLVQTQVNTLASTSANHETRIATAESTLASQGTRLSGAESNIQANTIAINAQAMALNNKANKANVYTKEQADQKFLTEGQLKTINGKSIVGIGNMNIEAVVPAEDKAKIDEVDNKADKADVYTKSQADAKFLTEHQHIKTINGQSAVGDGDITIEGMTDEQKAKLAEVDNKANSADVYAKSEVYSKTESDAKYLTEHQSLKTINGESIVGSGDIELGSGDVQSVSVNGGTPVEPDDEGNINLVIDEGAKEISDLSDGSRVSTLETQMASKADASELSNYATTEALSAKANQSDLNTTNGNVSTLQTKVGKLEQESSEFVKTISVNGGTPQSADANNNIDLTVSGGVQKVNETLPDENGNVDIAKITDDELNATYMTKGISGSKYDAARKILGGDWRIPTKTEWEELLSRCVMTYDSTNLGWVATANNGNSVFFSACGGWGNYRASNLYSKTTPQYCHAVAINKGVSFNVTRGSRNYLSYIRPVSTTQGVDLGLSVKWASTNISYDGFVEHTTDYGNTFCFGSLSSSNICNENEYGTSADPLMGYYEELEETNHYLDAHGLNVVRLQMNTKMGELTSLDTTDKTSIVNAINELYAMISALTPTE